MVMGCGIAAQPTGRSFIWMYIGIGSSDGETDADRFPQSGSMQLLWTISK